MADALTAAEREPGQVADEGVRRRVEGVTGADLGGVRVHTGTASAQAAGALSAQAYTVGQEVHFGEGRYQPGTPAGDRLLAHELVHAAQQGPQPSKGVLQAKAEVSQPGDPAEQEADRLADQALAGGGDAAGAGAQVTPSVMKVARKIQREEKEGSSELPVAPAVDAKAKPDAEEEREEDQGEEVGPPDASAFAGGGGDEGGGAVSAGGGGEGGGGGAVGAEGAQEVSAKDGAAAKEGGGGPAEQVAPVVAAEGAQAGSTPEKKEKEVVSEGQADAGASGQGHKAVSSQGATENTAAPQPETPKAAQPTAETPKAAQPTAETPKAAQPTAETRSTPAPDAQQASSGAQPVAPVAENKAGTSRAPENVDEAKPSGAKKEPAAGPTPEKQAVAPVTERPPAPAQEDAQKNQAAARQAPEEHPAPGKPQPQRDTAAPESAPRGDAPAPVAVAQGGKASPEAPDAKPRSTGGTTPDPAKNANGGGGGGGGGGASKAAASDPGFQSVKGQVAKVAAVAAAHAPAAQAVEAAHGAAQSPSNEVQSQAEARHMGGLAATEPAPFSRGAFKAALRQKIAEAAPKNLDEASNFQGNNQLGQVKSVVAAEVGKGKEQTTGPIEKKNREAPDQAGLQPKAVTPLAPPEKSAPPSVPNAAAAAPKRKPDAAVDMKSGPAEVDRKMAEAEVTEPQLQRSNEPKFQAAVEAKKDAKADAEVGPKKYRQVEQPALAGAQAGAEALVQQQLQAMGGGRQAALQGVLGQQHAAKGQDEQARAQVAQKIQQIFGVCQQKVEARLGRLDAEVNAAFDAGAGQARKLFEGYVGRRMDAYKEERYSGLLGAGRWIKDKFLGMPDEVNAFYGEGQQRYLAAMEATIDRVATMVETGLREATAEVARGKKEVDDYVKSLPAALRQVGQQAQAQIQAQFDGLGQSIKDKQGELVDTLAQKYNDETQKLDQRVGELKAQNRGLVDKALDLVGDVVQTIKKLGEMLRSVLARAAGIVGRILADPIGFVGNLVRGAREGFSRFVANIGEHLQQGLFGWLTGALAGAGLQMPASFDLKGIFSLVSQVLNMTWQAIRSRAVRILGERAVRALERGSEIVKLLMTGGPAAIWEHVKSFVGDLKTLVVDQLKNFVIGKVISAGVTWLLSLLNPASAFVKACKAIYDIVMFFVERAAQIADLVNAVLDSIEAVGGGAVGAMVTKIEQALVKALPVVIGFLASLLGIGGISEKVKAIIQKVRVPIEKAIDWVLKKAWEALKKTGKWLGLVKDKDKAQEHESAKEQAHKEQVGAKVTFTAHGEAHTTWVDAKGGVPVPMVASAPSAVKAKIEEWRPRLRELPQDEGKRAGSLIGKAIAIEKSVSGLAAKVQSGGDEAALKGKQQRLADTLAQLFEVMAPGTDPAKSFADQDPKSTLKSPQYQQFKGRFIKLADDLTMPGGDARAQEIWLKVVTALQRTHGAYQTAPNDAKTGRKDLTSEAFQQVMSQFEPITHALKPYMEKFAHGKGSWAFWSGKPAVEVAKRNAESALEKSALGSLFDNININGSWDIQMWASLSKAYATHAAQHVGEAEFRGFVGMGSSADQSIFNKIEQPTFVGMLNEHAKAKLQLSWFAVAGDPKADMKQPDWRFHAGSIEGVYASGGRSAMVEIAERENKRRLEQWKDKGIDEGPGAAHSGPEGGTGPIVAGGQMQGHVHKLTVDLVKKEIRLASAEGEALAKVQAAIDKIRAMPATAEQKDKAQKALRDILGTLRELKVMLERRVKNPSDKPDPAGTELMREKAQSVMDDLAKYGKEFKVGDIDVDLPKFDSAEEYGALAKEEGGRRLDRAFTIWEEDVRKSGYKEGTVEVWSGWKVKNPDGIKGPSIETLKKAVVDGKADGTVKVQNLLANPSDLKKQFHTLAGKAVEAQVIASGLAKVSKDESKAAIQKALYVYDGEYGKMEVPTTKPEADPKLKDAVTKAGGIVSFMHKMAAERVAGEMTHAEFEAAWTDSANVEWLKNAFRGADPGKHEWIPSNMIRDVIARAHKVNDLEVAAAWIELHHELRAPTDGLIFNPSYGTTKLTVDGAAVEALCGHSGALYVKTGEEGKGEPLTEKQNEWHGELRKAFAANESILACIEALERIFAETIWNGEARIPSRIYREYCDANGNKVAWATIEGDQKRKYDAAQAVFERCKKKAKS